MRGSSPTNEMTVPSVPLEAVTLLVAHGERSILLFCSLKTLLKETLNRNLCLLLVSSICDTPNSFIPFLSTVPRLTAFVLRCFLQAQTYIQINQRVLSRAVTWLLRQQGPQGGFSEAGRVMHTEMQGGLDDDSAGLTAYVLMALLEDESYVVREEGPEPGAFSTLFGCI